LIRRRRSTVVTSQVPVTDGHGLIGHATYADAILDRLVHNARRIELSGDSMRRPKHPSRVQRLGEHAKINPK
jgi:DNA replication protein DnaC